MNPLLVRACNQIGKVSSCPRHAKDVVADAERLNYGETISDSLDKRYGADLSHIEVHDINQGQLGTLEIVVVV